MKAKKITITISYEEENSTLQLTAKHTIITDKPLADILDEVKKMDQKITGVTPLL